MKVEDKCASCEKYQNSCEVDTLNIITYCENYSKSENLPVKIITSLEDKCPSCSNEGNCRRDTKNISIFCKDYLEKSLKVMEN